MFDRTEITSRRTYLKAAGVAGIAGLAGCLGDDDDDDGDDNGVDDSDDGDDDPGELPTVNVAYVVAGGNKPSLFEIDELRDEVATNDGEVYNLTVESISNTPTHVDSVASGDLQIGMSTVVSMPSAILQEAVPGGVTAIAADYVDAHPDHFSIATWTSDDSDIETAADLEGKTVAVNGVGTGVHAIVEVALDDAGVDSDTVNFEEFPFPGIQTAIDDGAADAGIVPNTFSAQMELAGGYHKVFDSADVFDEPYPFTYLFAAKDYIEDEPEVVEAFLEDYSNLVEYITDEDNRDDVVQLLVDEFNADFDVYDHVFYTENDYYHPSPPEINVEGLQGAVDKLADLGFIDDHVDMEPHIDNSYLP